jgi:hypothetical protein
MREPWRLILRNDVAEQQPPVAELYDLDKDPGQATDLAATNPAVTAELRRAYDTWWQALSGDFDRPAEIVLGDDAQNPTTLTCFEWHSSQQWQQTAVKRGFEGNGFWTVRVAKAGRYEIALRRWPAEVDQPITAAFQGGRAIAVKRARLQIGDADQQLPVESSMRAAVFQVTLPAGSARLQTWFYLPDGKSLGAYYAIVRRLDAP